MTELTYLVCVQGVLDSTPRRQWLTRRRLRRLRDASLRRLVEQESRPEPENAPLHAV